jgi:flagellar biosynthesis/type III secretory pathway chaperone
VSLQQLNDSLRQTHQLYSELVELGLEKKDQVIHNRLNDLTQTLTKESKVLKRLADADEARVQAVLAFQREIGLPASPAMPLSELPRHVAKASDKATVEQLLKQISDKARELKRINDLNQSLIEHALDFVEYSLELLVGLPEEVVYQAPAQQTPAMKRSIGMFDTKA